MAIIPKQLGTHYLDPYEWPALMEKFEGHIPVPDETWGQMRLGVRP